jgi:hypothetical protein
MRRLLPIAIAAAVTLPASAAVVELDFSFLPSQQGWCYLGPPEPGLYAVDGSRLTIDTRGEGPASPVHSLRNAIEPDLPFRIDVRARLGEVESGDGFAFGVSAFTGAEASVFLLSPHSVAVSGTVVSLDTTVVRDYRMDVVPGVGLDFFVDGVHVLAKPAVANASPNGVLFGDPSTTENGYVEVSRFEVSVPGIEMLASVPPSVNREPFYSGELAESYAIAEGSKIVDAAWVSQVRFWGSSVAPQDFEIRFYGSDRFNAPASEPIVERSGLAAARFTTCFVHLGGFPVYEYRVTLPEPVRVPGFGHVSIRKTGWSWYGAGAGVHWVRTPGGWTMSTNNYHELAVQLLPEPSPRLVEAWALLALSVLGVRRRPRGPASPRR